MLRNEDYQHIFHEIKNMITIINSSLQLIEKQHPEVSGFAYWNDTISDVHVLRNIIIELSTARLGSDLNKTSTDMNKFMEQIMNSARVCFEDTNIRCTFHAPDNLKPVSIDQMRLREAIVNLLKNSYEAVGTSGAIDIYAYEDSDSLCLDIKDSGCGMDPQTLDQLYTPFFTSKDKGNGLGLVITKSIIEAHGGSLTCQSMPQKGTTFTISLPFELPVSS